jgi:hypothetical protein
MKCFALFALLFLVGCTPKPPIRAWRFKTCAPNGDHEVCTCEHFHEEINVKAPGGRVGVCE